MTDESTDTHWLVRPTTLRWLAGLSLVVLALSVLAQWWVPYKGYFGFDDWTGFAAVFGFISCLLMVLAARLMGLVLKRPENYYSGDDDA